MRNINSEPLTFILSGVLGQVDKLFISTQTPLVWQMRALNEISPNAANTPAPMKNRSEGITAPLSGVPQLGGGYLGCLRIAVGVCTGAHTHVHGPRSVGVTVPADAEVEFDHVDSELAAAALGKGKSPRNAAGASRRVWRFTCLLRTASLKAAIGTDGVACCACVPIWSYLALNSNFAQWRDEREKRLSGGVPKYFKILQRKTPIGKYSIPYPHHPVKGLFAFF